MFRCGNYILQTLGLISYHQIKRKLKTEGNVSFLSKVKSSTLKFILLLLMPVGCF